MLHEPLRAIGRQSTLLHDVQHGGVSCMGVTNHSLALSGHARQFRAETLCSAKRGKGKGARGPLPHGGWGRVLDFVLTHVLIALTMSAARSRGRHQVDTASETRKKRSQMRFANAATACSTGEAALAHRRLRPSGPRYGCPGVGFPDFASLQWMA